ncbi:MAG: ribbon-helix-helix domain-containing protein [Desulfobacterota bacterium]|jgi:metal-responsive CopG/Arc/MetJ family transcriptional regulator|nr:ribbon-helix-helix domain-containing protein [Thermodesulfobacteriota bacterium]
MQRTTIFADEYLLKEIKDLARQEKRSAADLIRDALAEYLHSRKSPVTKFSFIGIGESGRHDLAERHEEYLWAKPSRPGKS